jgi:transcription-repair coupling factor (superfamily II helicase)
MAMSGIRDISLLDEAPGDRQPVQSCVLEHDELIINDAIRRELSRGGQVFYLYNFVETISYTADKIRSAFPEANVVVAHGKMDKEQLEDIWRDMITGEIDVLVSTTIIETGVDVPNANTLIVENAHRMGLSQLHQIRGRVGRSARQAYAYFTYRAGKVISEVAAKRLSAIREFAEFGAGFRVALRDLEIRGAGNLLGAQQHGYIESVGYDLYVKLLNEAVLTESGRMPENGRSGQPASPPSTRALRRRTAARCHCQSYCP